MNFVDLNVEARYWVGVHKVFGQSWSWLTLEPLRLGVPFWGYDQGDMDGMDCATIDATKNYQLSGSACDVQRQDFVFFFHFSYYNISMLLFN